MRVNERGERGEDEAEGRASALGAGLSLWVTKIWDKDAEFSDSWFTLKTYHFYYFGENGARQRRLSSAVRTDDADKFTRVEG